MKKFIYVLLVLICLTSGTLLFLIQRKWLIIHWAFKSARDNTQTILIENSTQQKVRLYFWKNNKFQHEDAVIIWNTNNKPDTLKHLIDAWLITQNDENLFSKKIKVENIALDSYEQDAFISFDQTFPWQEWSINQKWLTIESLLKTIKEANLEVKYINILTHGKPLEDAHISFIQHLPIEGFK